MTTFHIHDAVYLDIDDEAPHDPELRILWRKARFARDGGATPKQLADLVAGWVADPHKIVLDGFSEPCCYGMCVAGNQHTDDCTTSDPAERIPMGGPPGVWSHLSTETTRRGPDSLCVIVEQRVRLDLDGPRPEDPALCELWKKLRFVRDTGATTSQIETFLAGWFADLRSMRPSYETRLEQIRLQTSDLLTQLRQFAFDPALNGQSNVCVLCQRGMCEDGEGHDEDCEVFRVATVYKLLLALHEDPWL